METTTSELNSTYDNTVLADLNVGADHGGLDHRVLANVNVVTNLHHDKRETTANTQHILQQSVSVLSWKTASENGMEDVRGHKAEWRLDHAIAADDTLLA